MPILGSYGSSSSRGFGRFGSVVSNANLVIGQAFGGGFFAGKMSIGGKTYAIVISPAASGVVARTNGAKTTSTADTPNTLSPNDGLANTIAMGDGLHQYATAVRAFTIGGFNDWYIPSRDEMELLYRNLKPTTGANATGARIGRTGDSAALQGVNDNSIPTGPAYTGTDPLQTGLTAFKVSNAQALLPYFGSDLTLTRYWTSTEDSTNTTKYWTQDVGSGVQTTLFKQVTNFNVGVRAIRRVELV